MESNDWIRGAELAQKMVAGYGYDHADHYYVWLDSSIVGVTFLEGFKDFLGNYRYYMDHVNGN